MAEPQLNLIVLRAADVERTVGFYRTVGVDFQEEQHSKGPAHYAGNVSGTILEIYPANEKHPVDAGTRLGFAVPNLQSTIFLLGEDVPIISEPKPSAWGTRTVVRDPDGRTVELVQQQVAPLDSSSEAAGIGHSTAGVIRHVFERPEMYVGSRSEPVAIDAVLAILHHNWAEAFGRNDELMNLIVKLCEEEGDNSGFLNWFRRRHPQGTDEQAFEYILAVWKGISLRLGILDVSIEHDDGE